MAEAIAGIDHVLIGVHDLEAARGLYERLGFTLTPRGSHIGWGTANYCIMFERDYIELLGITDPTLFTNNLDRFLRDRQGLMSVAFATEDAEQAAAILRARGIAADGPKALARRLELPEGTVLPRFALLHPAPEALPGLPAFICEHLTPELLRRPEWLRHPNGAQAIASVTVVAANPGSFAAAYRRLLGEDAVTTAPGRLILRPGNHEMVFADPTASPPDSASSGSGAPLLPGTAVPYLAAMDLRAADPAKMAGWLAARGIALECEPDGSLLLAPAATMGLWLRFSRAS